MSLKQLVVEIDREIARLKEARQLLSGDSTGATRRKAKTNTQPAAKKRTLSPEARERIAEGMKRRWAERRKASNS